MASQSYWDRTPYVEVDDETGAASYVEHHRTLGDWVRAAGRPRLRAHHPARAGVAGRTTTGCGAAGPRVRGTLTPGTAIFGADL